MAKATWNGTVIAESDKYEQVEGNIYFPPESVKKEFLKSSATPYTCAWKGEATYYNVVVDGEENKDAAWAYNDPKEEAKKIKEHVAFDTSKVNVEE